MDWQNRIIDEIGYLVATVEITHALGGWIPLFTVDRETAILRKKWIIEQLCPIMYTWDKFINKRCEISTISKDDEIYGVKVMIISKSLDNY